MDNETRTQLIATYRDGHRAVVEAVEGATDAELDARPGPDDWSARMVVHHLADSETTSSIRLRKLLAEDRADIQGYDEMEFARRLHYDRPIEASLEVLRAVRTSTAELLDRMTEADWSREGVHTESGRYGTQDWLRIYATHAHDHADQIRRARVAAR
jgi:hypothetical protein